MNNKTIDKIKNVDFDDIDLTEEKGQLFIKINSRKNINKLLEDEIIKESENRVLLQEKFLNSTIGIYDKNPENMDDKELFNFITNMFFQTGDIFHMSIIKDYIVGFPSKFFYKYLFINSSSKELYINKDNNFLDEEFFKKCEISMYKGITDKIDILLDKTKNVNLNVFLSDKISITEYENNKQEISSWLFLNEDEFSKFLFNYLITSIFNKDGNHLDIRFDEGKNNCLITKDNLNISISGKELIQCLTLVQNIEKECEKERNLKRQLTMEVKKL